jgi:hypothetical protein
VPRHALLACAVGDCVITLHSMIDHSHAKLLYVLTITVSSSSHALQI